MTFLKTKNVCRRNY